MLYPEWERWNDEEVGSYRSYENKELRLLYALNNLPPRSPGSRAKFLIEMVLSGNLDYEAVMRDVSQKGRPSALHKLEDMAVMYLKEKARDLDGWSKIKNL